MKFSGRQGLCWNLTWSVLCLCAVLKAGAALPAIGEPAPLFQLEKTLQAPTNAPTQLADFRGSVLVLDFWATWCSPCIESIPHVNELADRFRGHPVRFLAITDENEQVVSRFLQRRAFHAWIGLDGVGASVRDRYGITGIPTVFLINQDGVIVGITHPGSLTAGHIEEVLATGKCSMPAPRSEPPGIAPAPTLSITNAPALFEASVRRSAPHPSGMGYDIWSMSEDRCDLRGEWASVETAIHRVFDIPAQRLLKAGPLPKGEYDFVLRAPPGNADRLAAAFSELLRSTFGLSVTRTNIEQEVMVLRSSGRPGPGLAEVNPAVPAGGGDGLGELNYHRSEVKAVAEFLAERLRVPVLDETALTNRFDIRLKWELSAAERLLVDCDRRALMALTGDLPPEQSARMSPEARRFVAFVRGTLPAAESALLSAEAREQALAVRTELGKPDAQRFAPDPAKLMKAAEEQLGLKFTREHRSLPHWVTEPVSIPDFAR
ncbi:MAG: TIGR03435 family protein [Verrucomicrobiae bacterium]|nr:TIGR03435 family protein [Verrucomicrobiae bacterium]